MPDLPSVVRACPEVPKDIEPRTEGRHEDPAHQPPIQDFYDTDIRLALFGGEAAQVLENPVKYVLNNSPFWLIVFVVLGIAGFVLQVMHNRSWEAQTYNRLSDTTASA